MAMAPVGRPRFLRDFYVFLILFSTHIPLFAMFWYMWMRQKCCRRASFLQNLVFFNSKNIISYQTVLSKTSSHAHVCFPKLLVFTCFLSSTVISKLTTKVRSLKGRRHPKRADCGPQNNWDFDGLCKSIFPNVLKIPKNGVCIGSVVNGLVSITLTLRSQPISLASSRAWQYKHRSIQKWDDFDARYHLDIEYS